ncbi:hypothetical protein CL617_02735 [archaeon]|nr:hypothetical protein [archaeon]|tara:strand:+ start:8665 stop:9483 length:819 start_codon:yes stop_codon:yes gene_type:complete
MIAIITSKKCPVGINVSSIFLDSYNFKETENFEDNPVYTLNENKDIKLYTINELHINAENLHKKIKADLFLFVSTHRSKKQVNSLSIHPIGNWNDARLGGLPNKLVPVNSNYLKELFLELEKNNNLDYETIIESTHHGPYNEKPCLFIEIGSSEKQWQDKKAGEIIAKTVINTLTKKINSYKNVVIFGGTHYNYLAIKILKQSNYSISHICPKYNMESLSENLIKQSFEKSIPKPEFAVIEWKSMNAEQRNELIQKFDSLKIKYKKDKELFN